MTDAVTSALRQSRELSPDPQTLPVLFSAEEAIARMSDDDVVELQDRLGKNPSDGFLYLWLGLAARERKQWTAALDAFGHAIRFGVSHWRVGWYVAQTARSAGQVSLVDQACASVLKAAPQFWFARELPKHARGYYSQAGQDKVVEQFFAKCPPRHKVFVEVGAFDGVHYSNVRRLHEKYKWSGVTFEPVSKNYRKAAASYAGTSVRCVQAAVSTVDAEMEINVSTYPHLPDWGSDVATFGAADTERWAREFGATWTKEKVPVRRLSSLLDEAGIEAFDFISIDTEGHDLEVLKSIDFKRYRPQLIVIEYGENKAAIARILESEGYGVLQDNGMDFVACPKVLPRVAPAITRKVREPESVGSISLSASDSANSTEIDEEITVEKLPTYLERMNPHLVGLGTLPIDRAARLQTISALDLLVPARFDIPAKTVYARHRGLGVQSDWARELYHAHIRAFSGGTCREGDGRKHSIDDYFAAFHALLDDVRARGFDSGRSLIPVAAGNVAIDGAHRIAAGVVHGHRVSVLRFDCATNRFDAQFFTQRGLSAKFADAITLEYCRLRSDTFVVTIFPSAAGCEQEIRAILGRHGQLVYAKAVALNRQGARNLICEFYAGEPWLGDWRNGFAGAKGKMEPCFRGEGPVRVYVLQARNLDEVRAAKTEIRDMFGLSNHSVHINDTHAETIRLAQLFFNANSIHFLNHAQPKYFERFARHLDRYRQWLQADGRDPERFCIDGSAVLAAYGLRDAQDLDVLHHGEADFRSVMPEVNSHNADAHHHATTRDDIIFNPENHFYAFGLKFASIDVLRRLKGKRDEGKDRVDVALIDACCGVPAAEETNARPPRIVALVPARNEAARLPFCLRALKPYADAVVYLDDCSDDASVSVVESLAEECRVERILRKTVWHRDEPGDRNALLAAGREIGGTHFVVLDADEAFTANCARDDYLRRLLLSLRPGETLTLSWIQLWRSMEKYRFDRSQWTYASKAFAFCDDGRATYQSGFIHTQRIPNGLKGRTVPVVNYVHGVMHFQFVDWPNLQIKQAWYRCMERVRQPRRAAREINAQYAPSEDESGLELRDVPVDWFAGYDNLDTSAFSARDERRGREVIGWFREHGAAHFADLDIWRVDWADGCDDVALAADIRTASRRGPEVTRTFALPAEAHRKMVVAREHLGRGDVAACRRSIEDALASAPDHPEIVAALGNLHFMSKEFAAARQRFEASLALRPEQPMVWAQLAATQLQLKNQSGFVSAVQKSLALDAECKAALRLMADFQARNGQHRPAAGAYRKLACLEPADAGIWSNLGRSLAACGELDEAEEALRQALIIDPKLAAVRRALEELKRKNAKRHSTVPAEAPVCAR